MNFIEELRNLSTRIESYRDLVQNEASTKNTFVEPFINLLGYDTSNPREVKLEFTADVPPRQGEKVDYALFKNSKPAMIVECKSYGEDLSATHVAQLVRYFSAVEPQFPFAVLTDGVLYQFYADIEASNKMDREPFLEFDMLDIQQSLANELKGFTKPNFDLDKTLAAAIDLKHSKEIKDFIMQQVESPADEFVNFVQSVVLNRELTPTERERFPDSIKRALNELMKEGINPSPSPVIDEEDTPDSNPRPIGFTFNNEQHRVEPRTWKQYLVIFCEILSRIYTDRFEEVLTLDLGQRRPYFSREPEHLIEPRQIRDTGIYIHTCFSASQIKKVVRRLAEHFGYDEPRIEHTND